MVLEEFSSFKEIREEKLQLSHFQEFANLWAQKDPYGEGRINAMELIPMLWAMGPPLGFDDTMTTADVFEALRMMDVPVYPDKTVRYGASVRRPNRRASR